MNNSSSSSVIIASVSVCEGCGKAAKFKRPICLKLSLSPSFFCSQECFKASWPKHKAAHSTATPSPASFLSSSSSPSPSPSPSSSLPAQKEVQETSASDPMVGSDLLCPLFLL